MPGRMDTPGLRATPGPKVIPGLRGTRGATGIPGATCFPGGEPQALRAGRARLLQLSPGFRINRPECDVIPSTFTPLDSILVLQRVRRPPIHCDEGSKDVPRYSPSTAANLRHRPLGFGCHDGRD